MAEFDAISVKDRALAALVKNSSDPEGKLILQKYQHYSLIILENFIMYRIPSNIPRRNNGLVRLFY